MVAPCTKATRVSCSQGVALFGSNFANDDSILGVIVLLKMANHNIEFLHSLVVISLEKSAQNL